MSRYRDFRLLSCILAVILLALSTFVSPSHRVQATTIPWMWVPTGDLIEARNSHTATLLDNGTVMIVGGRIFYNISLASAEIYNPSTGVWASGGSLTESRLGHTASLLPDGKVLVVGGWESINFSSRILSSAELYDPTLGTWTATGSLSTARTGHTTTVLLNGKVLVVGGDYSSLLASAELYDPALGTWVATGSLSTARTGHTATLLPDGRVLVAGGWANGSSLASAEIYDPTTEIWSAAGSLSTARRNHRAVLLENGKILLVGGATGGIDDTTYLSSAELYDPATGNWTITGSMSTIRDSYTVTLVNGGKVLAVGGLDELRQTNASAELYDPLTGEWDNAASLSNARYWHTATLLSNGEVLVTGGYAPANSLTSTEIYKPLKETVFLPNISR